MVPSVREGAQHRRDSIPLPLGLRARSIVESIPEGVPLLRSILSCSVHARQMAVSAASDPRHRLTQMTASPRGRVKTVL